MDLTKQELIGWASQGVNYIKTGFNYVIEQIESKLETEGLIKDECFKDIEGKMWGASPKAVKDVCEFKDRLSQMWEDKEPETPKTLTDYVRLTKNHISEINNLYNGLLEMANKIDAKSRAQRKELENRLETTKKLLDDYRYVVGGKNQHWSQDSDVKKKAAEQRAAELKKIEEAKQAVELQRAKDTLEKFTAEKKD